MLAGLGELRDGLGGLSVWSIACHNGCQVILGLASAPRALSRLMPICVVPFPSACLLHTHNQRRVKPRVAPAGSGWLAGCSPYMPPLSSCFSSSLLKSQSERTDVVLSSCM